MGLFGPSAEKVWAAERVKPEEWVWDFKAKYGKGKGKGPQEMVLKTHDGRRFIIPDGKTGRYHKSWDGRRWHKTWFIENGQVVEWSPDLGVQPNPLLDNQTVTAVQNRGSARRLAAQAGSGDKWIYMIMGGAICFALAWVLYPQLNHPAPILTYCQQLANGTMYPRTCPVP